MDDLRESNAHFASTPPRSPRCDASFAADSIDNATCLDTIQGRCSTSITTLWIPHTAVAYQAAQNLRGENPVLVASTAHWAKFGDNVFRALA